MTSAMTIGETARRSGVPPATLRYYDEIGLVPAAERTTAGYRLYDEGSLDRLRFVGRAKRLGCSLDEIAELLVAYDGGRCGPVQDGLRDLVAAKLAEGQQQLLETSMLLADLQQAAADLVGHRPDGPCDESCGCVVEAPRAPRAEPVRFGRGPVACSLPADEMPDRLAAFQAVFADVVRRLPIDGGIRLELAGTDVDVGELAELLAAEQRCCPFWAFALTVDARGVGVEVRDDARPLVDGLFGVPS